MLSEDKWLGGGDVEEDERRGCMTPGPDVQHLNQLVVSSSRSGGNRTGSRCFTRFHHTSFQVSRSQLEPVPHQHDQTYALGSCNISSMEGRVCCYYECEDVMSGRIK